MEDYSCFSGPYPRNDSHPKNLGPYQCFSFSLWKTKVPVKSEISKFQQNRVSICASHQRKTTKLNYETQSQQRVQLNVTYSAFYNELLNSAHPRLSCQFKKINMKWLKFKILSNTQVFCIARYPFMIPLRLAFFISNHGHGVTSPTKSLSRYIGFC